MITHALGYQTKLPPKAIRETDLYAELKLMEIFSRPSTTGIWYDPQDLTTLFQDAQGTLPVYRPGTGLVDPPVGLMLDKSKGLELGPEKIPQPVNFAGDIYSTLGTVDVSENTIVVSSTNGGLQAPGIISVGSWFVVELSYSGMTASGIQLQVNVGTGGPDLLLNSSAQSGAIKKYFRTNISGTIYIRLSSAGEVTITSISVREIKGYHAYQTTPTARPTLSGRYNLLTATTTLSTQSVTTVATNYTLSFSGTGTVTLSGTATGTLSAGAHTIPCTDGALTCTVAGSVTKADLRVKRDGSSLPEYQRVDNANTYDTAGFPLYLKRDRVDDDLIVQAPAITGAWAHGTIDGPVLGTVAIPAGEYHPFGADVTFGLPNCTQWIAVDGTLNASEQAVLERYVYSKARQLSNALQFGSASDLTSALRSRNDITSVDFSYWDTSRVVSFDRFLHSSPNIPSLDISNLNFSKNSSFVGFCYNMLSLTNVIVGNAFDNTTTGNFNSSFFGTKLNQDSIDNILISINNANTVSGNFQQTGGSAPSATGQAAITAMRSRGWTVAVTGGF